jgi:hypothetical protein
MLDSGPRVELAESPASDGLPGVFLCAGCARTAKDPGVASGGGPLPSRGFACSAQPLRLSLSGHPAAMPWGPCPTAGAAR